MAEKVKGIGKGKVPGPGHNLKIDRSAAKQFFDRLDRLHDDMEKDHGKHMQDIGEVYDQAAEKLGIKTGIVREVYREHKAARKKLARQKKMSDAEVDQTKKLTAALASWKSSPLFKSAEAKADLDKTAKAIAKGDPQPEPELRLATGADPGEKTTQH